MRAVSPFFGPLDLPVDPLKRSFALPRGSTRNHYHVFAPDKILNRKTIEKLRDANLTVETVALFYKRPGSIGIIHTDVAMAKEKWRRNVAALNWNLSGADSLMRWYKIDGKGREPDLVSDEKEEPWYYVLNGIHYGFFGSRKQVNLPKSKVRILEEASIGSATLVRTDIPHAVENTDAVRGRWAVSVRFAPDFKNWCAAVAAFRPLLLPPLLPPDASSAFAAER